MLTNQIVCFDQTMKLDQSDCLFLSHFEHFWWHKLVYYTSSIFCVWTRCSGAPSFDLCRLRPRWKLTLLSFLLALRWSRTRSAATRYPTWSCGRAWSGTTRSTSCPSTAPSTISTPTSPSPRTRRSTWGTRRRREEAIAMLQVESKFKLAITVVWQQYMPYLLQWQCWEAERVLL